MMKKVSFLLLLSAFVLESNAQNVGIGTTTPTAKLHVSEGSVVFTADGVAPPAQPADPPVSGEGRRMMWYADKAAFRAGRAAGNYWDKDQVGNYSFAGGYSTIASATASTAFGLSTRASGNYSFVGGGFATIASGRSATAFGEGAKATDDFSFAGGLSTTASGKASTALGSGTQAIGENSTALGYGSKTEGHGSFAAGSSGAEGAYSSALGVSKAKGDRSFAAGSYTTASGDYSFAANGNTFAASAYETVFGRYNTEYTPQSVTEWNASDRLFVIGNGTANTNRSNAFTVFKNGNVGIMTAQPNARLSVSGDASKTGGGVWAAWSDARLKKNIRLYTSGLKEILQINPVRFQYNELSGEENLDKDFVGIIAQEIEKVLPSTITIKQDSVLKDKRMYDGSELTYTLINAIKEQQAQIEALKKEVTELKNRK